MRLIDADNLIDYFYFGIDDKPIINGISDRKIIDIIKNQLTAYDIDKVVEELEKEAKRWEDSGKRYEDECEIAVGKGLRKAIEIVKQCGVSDDVCEWTKSKDYPFDWFVGCDGCEVNHRQGDYCPRCGKKIKMVE